LTRRVRFSSVNGRGPNGSNGIKRKHAKAPDRHRGGPTKAQQAARARILAEAGFKATREEIKATERELRGE
jgi:hypothetical protein